VRTFKSALVLSNCRNTLQHTATHCNTLQRTASHLSVHVDISVGIEQQQRRLAVAVLQSNSQRSVFALYNTIIKQMESLSFS